MNKPRKSFVNFIGWVILITMILSAIYSPTKSTLVRASDQQWVVYSENNYARYNVSQSTDDASLWIDLMLDLDPWVTYIIQPDAQMLNYFRFDNIDWVFNSTHRYIARRATLNLRFGEMRGIYTPYVSIYQETNASIATFSTYNDLVSSRTFNAFRGNWEISITYVNGWHDSHSIANVFNYLSEPSTDNDTIALVLDGIHNPNDRMIYTFDNGASYAPYLEVWYDLEVYTDKTPPTGSSYVDEYRDFDIWYSAPIVWLDFETFTLRDDQNNIAYLDESLYNASTVQAGNEGYLVKPIASDEGFNSTGWIRRRFGVNLVSFVDGQPAVVVTYALHWGVSDTATATHTNDMNEFFGLISDQYPNQAVIRLEVRQKDAVGQDDDPVSPTYGNHQLPLTKWVDIQYQWTTGNHVTKIYNDREMTSLNQTYTDNMAQDPTSIPLYEYAYCVGYSGAESATVTYDEFGNFTQQAGYWITDPDDNDTIINIDIDQDGDIDPIRDWDDDGDIDQDDAEAFIDWYLSPMNIEIDYLPNLGNTIILIMGLMGIVMIPASLIMFGRSLASGDIIEGLHMLLVLFFLGLSFVTIWLFG